MSPSCSGPARRASARPTLVEDVPQASGARRDAAYGMATMGSVTPRAFRADGVLR
jgi:hypothetical protein